MSSAAPIKITDDQGNLIGKIRQIRRRGRQMWEALGKSEEGRYIVVGTMPSRIEARDAVEFVWKFGV